MTFLKSSQWSKEEELEWHRNKYKEQMEELNSLRAKCSQLREALVDVIASQKTSFQIKDLEKINPRDAGEYRQEARQQLAAEHSEWGPWGEEEER